MAKHGHPRLPRIYLVRHGQTEWSLSGQHTGKTDIPLTADGEKIISELAPRIVGPGKLLDPTHLQLAFISPRQRAQKTFQLLFANSTPPPSTTEPGVQEWDYGKYEGKTASTIRKEFKEDWDIWVDGCEGGESADDMTKRCDKMIEMIVEKSREHHEGENEGCFGDILIVSHGHFTRCFLTRWCNLPMTQGRLFVADVGAIAICGYQHGSFKERSLLGLNLFGEIE